MSVRPGFDTSASEPFARSTRSFNDHGSTSDPPLTTKPVPLSLTSSLQPIAVDREVDRDPVGAAVANRVGDRLAQQLLEIEM